MSILHDAAKIILPVKVAVSEEPFIKTTSGEYAAMLQAGRNTG